MTPSDKRREKTSEIIHVLIEQDYIKKGDKVYWIWRFNGQGRWNYRLTPLKDVPYVKFKLP